MKKFCFLTILGSSLVFSSWAAAAPEIISRAVEIQLLQVVEVEAEVGNYPGVNGTNYTYVGTVDFNGKEKRSLLVFGDNKILAYEFESIQGDKLRTMTFARGSERIMGTTLLLSLNDCTTVETVAEFTLANNQLQFTPKSAPSTWCRTGSTFYVRILGNSDRTSVNDKTFVADYSVSEFGKAYRDEAGLIWSRLQIDNLGMPLRLSHAQASAYCGSLGARLPSVPEVTRFQDAIRDYKNPIFRIDGTTVIPSFPYTKESLELNRTPRRIDYDAKIQQLIPGLANYLRFNHENYTDDPGIVWNPSEGYNRLERPSGNNGTLCVR